MRAQTENSRSECSLQNAPRYEGNANASALYARLLASARAAQSRRRDLAYFLDARRRRIEFEQAMQSLSV